MALQLCSRIKDGTSLVLSLTPDLLCGPWDSLWAWARMWLHRGRGAEGRAVLGSFIPYPSKTSKYAGKRP